VEAARLKAEASLEAERRKLAMVCRGTWARVTIDHFRHLTLQNV
jgi:hypothetical protein